MNTKNAGLIFVLSILIGFSVFAQQRPDLSFDPDIPNPAYDLGQGSIIHIDEGHYNFHTKEGRYKPFSILLERDGYVVESRKGEFTPESLFECKILVIANAVNEINADPRDWVLPNPSAFTEAEIQTLKNWVRDGGSLFLIADHMPWPGAAEALSLAFGFKFINGFNICIRNPAYFWRSNATIEDNIVTNGRSEEERINRIPMAEGQAFHIPAEAKSILTFGNDGMILLPERAWEFDSETPLRNIEGLSQGAFMRFGKGRLVVFGEASIFTVQLGTPGDRKMGMNRFDAGDNYKLLLNIIHYLDGIID